MRSCSEHGGWNRAGTAAGVSVELNSDHTGLDFSSSLHRSSRTKPARANVLTDKCLQQHFSHSPAAPRCYPPAPLLPPQASPPARLHRTHSPTQKPESSFPRQQRLRPEGGGWGQPGRKHIRGQLASFLTGALLASRKDILRQSSFLTAPATGMTDLGIPSNPISPVPLSALEPVRSVSSQHPNGKRVVKL